MLDKMKEKKHILGGFLCLAASVLALVYALIPPSVLPILFAILYVCGLMLIAVSLFLRKDFYLLLGLVSLSVICGLYFSAANTLITVSSALRIGGFVIAVILYVLSKLKVKKIKYLWFLPSLAVAASAVIALINYMKMNDVMFIMGFVQYIIAAIGLLIAMKCLLFEDGYKN